MESEKNESVKKENLVSVVIECCKKPLLWTVETVGDWQAYIPESASCPECRAYFERKSGGSIAYKSLDNVSFSCSVCGSEIMRGTVAHPIHDNNPFPLLGSRIRQCYYEYVPYCPKCEKEPSSSGSIINISRKLD